MFKEALTPEWVLQYYCCECKFQWYTLRQRFSFFCLLFCFFFAATYSKNHILHWDPLYMYVINQRKSSLGSIIYHRQFVWIFIMFLALELHVFLCIIYFYEHNRITFRKKIHGNFAENIKYIIFSKHVI